MTVSVSPEFGSAQIVPLGPEVIGADQADRRCIVVVGPPRKTGEKIPPGERPVVVINEFDNGIRIKAQIRKPAYEPLAIQTIKFWGLAQSTRDPIEGKTNFPVRIVAGYGQRLYTLASITGMLCSSELDPAGELITTIQGFHGNPHALADRKRLKFGAGTLKSDGARAIAGLLGRLSGSSQKVITESGAGQRHQWGYTTNGSMADELGTAAVELGFEWCLCDGEVIVTKKDETTQELYVLAPESGLIGSPVPSSGPIPGKPQRLRARGLLNPTFRPFSKLLLRSAFHRGPFGCFDVGMDTDTGGGDWYVNLELGYLKGAK